MKASSRNSFNAAFASASIISLLLAGGCKSTGNAGNSENSETSGLRDTFFVGTPDKIEPSSSSYSIKERVELKIKYTPGLSMGFSNSIGSMDLWSPLTTFKGRIDPGELPLGSYTTSEGKEEFGTIVANQKDEAKEGEYGFCVINLPKDSLKYRQQICRRVYPNAQGNYVYENEIMFVGTFGVMKAKRLEKDLRKAFRAEAEGFKKHAESAPQRNEEAKKSNAEVDKQNAILESQQDLQSDLKRQQSNLAAAKSDLKYRKEQLVEYSAKPGEEEFVKEIQGKIAEQEQRIKMFEDKIAAIKAQMK